MVVYFLYDLFCIFYCHFNKAAWCLMEARQVTATTAMAAALSQLGPDAFLQVGGDLIHHCLNLLVLKCLLIILEGDGDSV